MATNIEQQIRQAAEQIRSTIVPFRRGAVGSSDGRIFEMNGLLTAAGRKCQWRAFSPALGDQWKYNNSLLGKPSWATVTLVPYPATEEPLVTNPFLRDAIHLAIDGWCTEEAKPASMGYSVQDPNRHIKWLEKTINRFGIPFSAAELVEEIPAITSVSLSTMRLMGRVLTQFPGTPEKDVNKEVVRVLVETPVEDVLVAFSEVDPTKDRVADFIQLVVNVRERGLSEEDKMRIISRSAKLEPLKKWYLQVNPGKI